MFDDKQIIKELQAKLRNDLAKRKKEKLIVLKQRKANLLSMVQECQERHSQSYKKLSRKDKAHYDRWLNGELDPVGILLNDYPLAQWKILIDYYQKLADKIEIT